MGPGVGQYSQRPFLSIDILRYVNSMLKVKEKQVRIMSVPEATLTSLVVLRRTVGVFKTEIPSSGAVQLGLFSDSQMPDSLSSHLSRTSPGYHCSFVVSQADGTYDAQNPEEQTSTTEGIVTRPEYVWSSKDLL